jgi:hypothetical protein
MERDEKWEAERRRIMQQHKSCETCGKDTIGPTYCSSSWHLVAERTALIEVAKALKALVDKLDLVKGPSDAAFALMHAHGMSYEGPNYGSEYKDARAALAALPEGILEGDDE